MVASKKEEQIWTSDLWYGKDAIHDMWKSSCQMDVMVSNQWKFSVNTILEDCAMLTLSKMWCQETIDVMLRFTFEFLSNFPIYSSQDQIWIWTHLFPKIFIFKTLNHLPSNSSLKQPQKAKHPQILLTSQDQPPKSKFSPLFHLQILPFLTPLETLYSLEFSHQNTILAIPKTYQPLLLNKTSPP